jgi:hypothetical protein
MFAPPWSSSCCPLRMAGRGLSLRLSKSTQWTYWCCTASLLASGLSCQAHTWGTKRSVWLRPRDAVRYQLRYFCYVGSKLGCPTIDAQATHLYLSESFWATQPFWSSALISVLVLTFACTPIVFGNGCPARGFQVALTARYIFARSHTASPSTICVLELGCQSAFCSAGISKRSRESCRGTRLALTTILPLSWIYFTAHCFRTHS